MFRGINTVSLDNKGRLSIPTKHRELLEIINVAKFQSLIITIDHEEDCLLMYPLIYWEEIESKIAMLPAFNPEVRRIQRLLIGHATEVLLDNQNRILLPQELRDYAKLNKKAVLVGQSKKIEIWDLDNWNEKRKHWLEANSLQVKDLPIELKTLSL